MASVLNANQRKGLPEGTVQAILTMIEKPSRLHLFVHQRQEHAQKQIQFDPKVLYEPLHQESDDQVPGDGPSRPFDTTSSSSHPVLIDLIKKAIMDVNVLDIHNENPRSVTELAASWLILKAWHLSALPLPTEIVIGSSIRAEQHSDMANLLEILPNLDAPTSKVTLDGDTRSVPLVNMIAYWKSQNPRLTIQWDLPPRDSTDEVPQDAWMNIGDEPITLNRIVIDDLSKSKAEAYLSIIKMPVQDGGITLIARGAEEIQPIDVTDAISQDSNVILHNGQSVTIRQGQLACLRIHKIPYGRIPLASWLQAEITCDIDILDVGELYDEDFEVVLRILQSARSVRQLHVCGHNVVQLLDMYPRPRHISTLKQFSIFSPAAVIKSYPYISLPQALHKVFKQIRRRCVDACWIHYPRFDEAKMKYIEAAKGLLLHPNATEEQLSVWFSLYARKPQVTDWRYFLGDWTLQTCLKELFWLIISADIANCPPVILDHVAPYLIRGVIVGDMRQQHMKSNFSVIRGAAFNF
eukprot:TRINITY_DN2997_c0_g1_i1.p1 TRINITY_DN2997_c0_g1~~TRINITY_DN2997_c0_g1_i1.p1  ORF type:complete len:536 (+),score=70.44 TRINITY_DN2997_c0_g1_i1:40-1608(+)